MYGTRELVTLADPLLPAKDNAFAHFKDEIAASEAFRSIDESLNHGRRKQRAAIGRDRDELARVLRFERLTVPLVEADRLLRPLSLFIARHGAMIAERQCASGRGTTPMLSLNGRA